MGSRRAAQRAYALAVETMGPPSAYPLPSTRTAHIGGLLRTETTVENIVSKNHKIKQAGGRRSAGFGSSIRDPWRGAALPMSPRYERAWTWPGELADEIARTRSRLLWRDRIVRIQKIIVQT